jgi:predicted Fe-Mo cluster-binding NifX family protein
VKIVVAANGTGLDAPISPIFGRSPFYVLVDTETMHVETMLNPETSSLRGAGFHSPELIAGRGAQAVVTGSVGPNAFRALQALGLPVYLSAGGTVRKAIEAYKAGRLQPAEDASVPTHKGRFRNQSVSVDRWTDTLDAVLLELSTSQAPRKEEIVALREAEADLRERLALVSQWLEQLEKEDER